MPDAIELVTVFIERWVGRTAEAHVGDRGLHRVRGHPVDRGNGVGHRRVALAVQHADRHQGRVLGHAVGRTTEQPGDEGAVPVAVLAVQAVTHEVDAGRRPADEVDVGGADPGVDDVRVHRGSSPRRREPVVEWEVRLVEAIQRPRRGGLRARDRDHRVLVDRCHPRSSASQRGRPRSWSPRTRAARGRHALDVPRSIAREGRGDSRVSGVVPGRASPRSARAPPRAGARSVCRGRAPTWSRDERDATTVAATSTRPSARSAGSRRREVTAGASHRDPPTHREQRVNSHPRRDDAGVLTVILPLWQCSCHERDFGAGGSGRGGAGAGARGRGDAARRR